VVDEPEREDVEERQFADVHAQAIEETTATLVHELEPILGLEWLHATKEIADYPKSQTKRQLDRFESLLRAIDTLSRAASVPKIEEFDLAAVLRRVMSAEQRDLVEIEVAGPEPMLVWGDVSLVELAVTNGVRNAVEASSGVGIDSPRKRVVVNWGETDKEYWIVVLDRGTGLPVNAVRMFDIGATTKQGHLGMGLALARRAVISLGGKLTVVEREDGGVRFECRWPKDLRGIRWGCYWSRTIRSTAKD
jgi:signal transduction histidine kinase